MGFSLNNLTLFGLVLAIGIVVDDAIVVVEAVEHHIEHGLSPREATIKAMEQVSGPVVAIGLVLAAVFVPCTFITGIIGQFFRQFALTIAVSTVISAFNSLTLSPALSALLLKRRVKGHFEALPWFAFAPWAPGWVIRLAITTAHALAALLNQALAGGLVASVGADPDGVVIGTVVGLVLGKPLNFLLGWSFRQFNRAFDFSTTVYTRAVSGLLRVSLMVLAVYGGLLVLTWWGFTHTPTGFIPQQDKGYLLVNVQLPDAASVTRTRRRRPPHRGDRPARPGRQAHRRHLRPVDLARRQRLELRRPLPDARRVRRPHACRPFQRRHRRRAAGTARPRSCRKAIVNIFGAPPVEGLGTAGGFKIIVQDTGDNGLAALQKTADTRSRRRRGRPQPARRVHQLPGRHALAGTHHRPHPGQGPRRLHRRHPHDAGVHHRAVLHQRLQPLRPHLAGQRAGPRRRSGRRSRTSSS